MYALLFLVGFFGFLGLAGLSALHSGQHSHHGGHGDSGLDATGHAHAHTAFRGGAKAGAGKAGHVAGAKAHGGRTHGGRSHGGKGAGKRFRTGWALTPFDILAYCTGAGAVGEILRQLLVNPQIVLGCAVLGALVFNFGLAKPALNLLLRFESRQSDGLEGSVAQEVEALTRFDAQGRGLVMIRLDGQLVQVLATLEREEHARGVTVAKGDRLLVVAIDATKNTCRVSREFAS